MQTHYTFYSQTIDDLVVELAAWADGHDRPFLLPNRCRNVLRAAIQHAVAVFRRGPAVDAQAVPSAAPEASGVEDFLRRAKANPLAQSLNSAPPSTYPPDEEPNELETALLTIRRYLYVDKKSGSREREVMNALGFHRCGKRWIDGKEISAWTCDTSAGAGWWLNTSKGGIGTEGYWPFEPAGKPDAQRDSDMQTGPQNRYDEAVRNERKQARTGLEEKLEEIKQQRAQHCAALRQYLDADPYRGKEIEHEIMTALGFITDPSIGARLYGGLYGDQRGSAQTVTGWIRDKFLK